jgi:hypothetical protein
LDDEVCRVELVYNYLVDEKVVRWILWNMLVKLLLLVLFCRIVHKSLHPLCEHDQVLIDHTVRNSLLVDLEHFKSVIVTRCDQVSVFGLVDNPVPVALSLVSTQLCFCLDVPYFGRAVFRVTDQESSLLIEHYAGYVIFVTWQCRMLPRDFIRVFPQLNFPVI